MIGIPDPTNGNQELAGRLQPYLRPGEQLLWCGRPDPAVIFNRADVIGVPFSLVWLGIALAIQQGAGALAAPQPFRLVVDLFVAMGIYLVAGRFVTRWIGKRRTVYGITPDRVLVRSGSTFRDTPVKGGSMVVRRGLGGRHATVVFEPFGSYIVSQMGTMTGPPMPGTGIPTMGPPTSRRVAPGRIFFADVAKPDAMLAAVNQARTVLSAGQAFVDRARG